MTDLTISLIHATFRSKGVSRAVRDKWLNLAHRPDLVEHCMGFEEEDSEVRDEYGIKDLKSGITPDLKTRFQTTPRQDSPSAVRNWNAAASISTGEILLGIADDLVPTYNWDVDLRKIIESDINQVLFWKLDDARCRSLDDREKDDILPRHPAMTRSYYQKFGFFFDPRFVSVGCDDQLLCIGIVNGMIRDGRSIKLHHALGKILDEQGELVCGCQSWHTSQSRSRSQRLIHDSRWKKSAEEILKENPLHWMTLCELSSLPMIGTTLLSARLKSPSFFHIFIILIKSKHIHLKNKSNFLLKFFKNYAVKIMKD